MNGPAAVYIRPAERARGSSGVIEVTRLNGLAVTINADLIKFVEATPDTLISLTTGEKIMVKEAVQLVADRVLNYRRQCCDCEKQQSSCESVQGLVSGLEIPRHRHRVINGDRD